MTAHKLKRLEQLHKIVEAAAGERRKLIAQLAEEGFSLRTIAKHAGISHTTVRNIVLEARKAVLGEG